MDDLLTPLKRHFGHDSFGTTREHVVRAVLEGIASSGADLGDAAVADTGRSIDTLRVDGGMSA